MLTEPLAPLDAVIRRLPGGVDYSCVKMIIHDVPAPLTAWSWRSRAEHDGSHRNHYGRAWAAFSNCSYRVIDRRISKLAAQLSVASASEERDRVQLLRRHYIDQFLSDIDPAAPVANRWIQTVLRRHPAQSTALDLEVWERSDTGPRLLERHTVPSSVPPWGDQQVSWIDPDERDAIYLSFFRRYFAPMMKQLPGHLWRSRRQPTGWQVVTKYLIPALYDYLRPFYVVRSYRHGLKTPSPGRYSDALINDIMNILRFEHPDFASELTAEQVTAAIQRYLDDEKTANGRPMGKAIFELRPPEEENKVT